MPIPCRIDLTMDVLKTFSLTFANNLKEKLVIGFDKAKNQFYIDRSESGKIDFEKNFASRNWAPRFSVSKLCKLSIIADESSIEIFVDGGLTVMTAIYFPNLPYDQLYFHSNENVTVNELRFTKLRSILK